MLLKPTEGSSRGLLCDFELLCGPSFAALVTTASGFHDRWHHLVTAFMCETGQLFPVSGVPIVPSWLTSPSRLIDVNIYCPRRYLRRYLVPALYLLITPLWGPSLGWWVAVASPRSRLQWCDLLKVTTGPSHFQHHSRYMSPDCPLPFRVRVKRVSVQNIYSNWFFKIMDNLSLSIWYALCCWEVMRGNQTRVDGHQTF